MNHSENCILCNACDDWKESIKFIIDSNQKMIDYILKVIVNNVNVINIDEDKIDIYDVYFMGCCNKYARDCFIYAFDEVCKELKNQHVYLKIKTSFPQYFDVRHGTKFTAAAVQIEWKWLGSNNRNF